MTIFQRPIITETSFFCRFKGLSDIHVDRDTIRMEWRNDLETYNMLKTLNKNSDPMVDDMDIMPGKSMRHVAGVSVIPGS